MTKFHHGREDGPETDAPEAMLERLREELNRRFYQGKSAAVWMRDQRELTLALTWPATWLNARGVGLPVADYERRLTVILDTISRHGELAKIRHFPAYLGDCIRKHFQHQGEELYAAGKSLRNALDLGFLKHGNQATPAASDPTESLATVHRVLAAGKRGPKAPKTDPSQASLF